MSKNDNTSFLYRAGVTISLVVGLLTINNTIADVTEGREARLTKLEQSVLVLSDSMAKVDVGNQRLTEYLFKLEQRLKAKACDKK